MPLILDTSVETERPVQVHWFPNDEEQEKEAITLFQDYVAKGMILKCFSDDFAEFVPPIVNESSVIFRILTENGDDRLVWDRRDKEQVREAREKFKEYLSKGYTAYVTRFDGTRGSKITDFDFLLENIELSKEAVLVPKTKPS